MVVELSGSVIIMVTAAAVSLLAAGVILETTDTFNTDTITNISIQAWDRFGSGTDLIWAEVTMTYPGGPLEISGDIELCFVPPEGAATCEITNKSPVWLCDAPANNNTRHDCWRIKTAGSANQLRFEGIVDVGFDAKRGDPLGYVVSGHLHDSSGTVGVR